MRVPFIIRPLTIKDLTEQRTDLTEVVFQPVVLRVTIV